MNEVMMAKPKSGSKTIVEIDLSESPYKNDMIHNRWHPDIPMVAWVKPGDDFIVQTYDWTGGFIQNNESADDVRDIDLSIVHFLSGPIGVEGAEPGLRRPNTAALRRARNSRNRLPSSAYSSAKSSSKWAAAV